MEYSFSSREKNGSICLILSYKVNSKWKQKTKQGFKTLREAKQYQDKLLAAAKKMPPAEPIRNSRILHLRISHEIYTCGIRNPLWNTVR